MPLVDLSAPIRQSPPEIQEPLRTDIEFSGHDEGAALIERLLGVPASLLRDGEGWAVEEVTPPELARVNALDFPGTVRPLLEALEEQVVVLRLMSQVDASTVMVRIGEENAHEALTGASFVSVGYG